MTIEHPGYVLRSTTPDEHRDILEANEANRDAAVVKMMAFCEELSPGSAPYGYNNEFGASGLRGLVVEAGTTRPAGMRWDTHTDHAAHPGELVLVPALQTARGKALANQMRALRHNPRSLGQVSAEMVVSNGSSRVLGCAIFEALGSNVYATYYLPLSAEGRVGRPSDRQRVESDPTWTPVPLSELFAARNRFAPEKASA